MEDVFLACFQKQSDDSSEYESFHVIIEAPPQIPYATLVACHLPSVLHDVFGWVANWGYGVRGAYCI